MKITLQHNNFAIKGNIQRKDVPEYIKKRTNELSYQRAKDRTSALSAAVFDDFRKSVSIKTPIYTLPANRITLFTNLAHSYEPFDINKAAVVLATAISQVESKNQFTVNNTDLTLLSKFFYSSNDYEAKFFVMSMLNKNGAREFLPIAENILECDENIATINNKKTNYQARLLLNKHYNLDKLKALLESDDVYKIGALNVLSKWGLERHIKLVEPLVNDPDFRIADKAKSVLLKLQNLQKQVKVPISKEKDRNLPDNTAGFDLTTQKNRLKYISPPLNNRQISTLGRFGYLSLHANLLKASINSPKSAEAYAKIYVRGSFVYWF